MLNCILQINKTVLFFGPIALWFKLQDLSLLSSRDWRITHGISHHLFANTFNDFEISALEPFLFFLPNPDKTWLVRFGTQIIAQVRTDPQLYFRDISDQFLLGVIFFFFLEKSGFTLKLNLHSS